MDKPFYQSKTFWFNTLFVIIALARYFGFSDYQPDADTSELAMVAVAIVNLVLRFISKAPIK